MCCNGTGDEAHDLGTNVKMTQHKDGQGNFDGWFVEGFDNYVRREKVYNSFDTHFWVFYGTGPPHGSIFCFFVPGGF